MVMVRKNKFQDFIMVVAMATGYIMHDILCSQGTFGMRCQSGMDVYSYSPLYTTTTSLLIIISSLSIGLDVCSNNTYIDISAYHDILGAW